MYLGKKIVTLQYLSKCYKMKYSELHKKLRAVGCYIIRQGGGHPNYGIAAH